MKILLVDDSYVKLAEIASVVKEVSDSFEIDTCVDCISALLKLKDKYDLIVLDVLLPIRKEEKAQKNGAKYVIDEIYRNKKVKPPSYILCLTQYEELVQELHPIWRTIRYDPTSVYWKVAIRELLVYISRQYSSDDRIIIDKIQTIFLEGRTDEIIFLETLKLYFPQYADKIKIKSEVGSGADWVSRQLIIWSASLPKDENGNVIKSVGVYDNDIKGRSSMEDLNRTIGNTSAESKCVKAFKYSTSCAKHLIPIYRKGIQLPITLEEMFERNFWLHARSSNWLEQRSDVDLLLKDPTNWRKMEMSLNDHINSLGFEEYEKIYLLKFKKEKKEEFCHYISQMAEPEKKTALAPLSIFLKEVIDYLMN